MRTREECLNLVRPLDHFICGSSQNLRIRGHLKLPSQAMVIVQRPALYAMTYCESFFINLFKPVQNLNVFISNMYPTIREK